MIHFILWYLIISIVGGLTFPLTYRMLPSLADRGYAISRTLGLLLVGYLFWLLASLGILRNDAGGLLFALAALIALSVWAVWGISLDELRSWWRARRRLVLVTEALFLAAFAGWTLVRSANPEALGTEKPMELAFINAILNSPTFPPHDPWLSGYAISYYYFGYVMVAMLAGITGTPGNIAFNLGISLVFGLSAIASFGLVYNLLNAHAKRISNHEPSPSPNVQSSNPRHPHSTLTALLGPLFVLLVSNLEGFLHMLHTRGLFWVRNASGELTSAVWRWLDIKDLNLPPEQPFAWAPTRFWWWWRASRVVQDYDLVGNPKEIIDEFPFFSYLLADLHPHVLAMPFAFLAMTLALALFLGGGRGRIEWLQGHLNLRTLAWGSFFAVPSGFVLLWVSLGSGNLRLAAVGLVLLVLGSFGLLRVSYPLIKSGQGIFSRSEPGEFKIGTTLHLGPATFLLGAVALGGMAFLNTWDFPFYVALYAAAYALGRVMDGRAKLAHAWQDFVWLGLALGVSGIVLYLPFYLGFSSQAGGILPNLIYPTRGVHLWVMFAPLLLPLIAYMIYLIRLNHEPRLLKTGLVIAVGFVLFLWIASLFLGLAITIIPQVGEFYQGTLGSPDSATLFRSTLTRRLTSPGGWITLTALFALTLALLLGLDDDTERVDQQQPESNEEGTENTSSPLSTLARPHVFALILILMGTLFTLGPEFFYLRDQFGWRMNTIFKFYYQAWLLWAIAAAYSSAFLLGTLHRGWAFIYRLGLLLVLVAGLIYPTFSLWSKTNGFQPTEWTLDSTAYLETQSPDEMAAIRWLGTAPPGVVAEAVHPSGGSYTNYGRVSMLSGRPAVLGWVGHESQWRGGHTEMGSRQADLERLYCTRDWDQAKAILDQYNIRYVYVGSLERTTYAPNTGSCPAGLVEAKFVRFLSPVFQQGQETIYEYVD